MDRDRYASKRALRVTNVALIVLLIIVLLFWWRGSSNFQFKGVNPGQISIRQQDGKIQYQFLDGEWQDIVSVASLKGEKGSDGKDGQDGKNGIDGKNGVNGLNGSNGTNGINGIDGKNGLNGAQGIQGQKGDRGEKGEQGNNGQDGREIEIRKDALYIQWRYKGDSNWNNLIAYSDLKGEKGDKGDTGAQGAKGDKGDKGEQGVQGPKGDQGIQGLQGIAGVGVPQTLSLNNGILSLSHGGGNVTLPQANFSEIVKIPLNSANPTSVFSSGSAGERTWHDFRNYMIFNKTTGQGFIHIDFWTTGSTMMALVNIPNSAPTPKELSETPLNNDDNSTVWIEKGSRTIYGRPRANKRYIANIPIFVDPSR